MRAIRLGTHLSRRFLGLSTRTNAVSLLSLSEVGVFFKCSHLIRMTFQA
jgi:hypothetical protein